MAGLEMIIEQLEVGDFAIFAYVLGCQETGEGIVIDPGAEAERIVAAARRRGIQRIRYIVNTHSHADHVGANRRMKELTGAAIVIHAADAEKLANPAAFILQMFRCEASPPADKTVADGDRIEFGKQYLTVVHTPGHTPGGMCLYAPGCVFTGDTLFVQGMGRTDLPGGSFETLAHSIQTRLFSLPEDTIVLPGHNYAREPRSTIGKEKKSNPFL